MSENNKVKLPEVMFFAGPNGSGKTTMIIPMNLLEYSREGKTNFIIGAMPIGATKASKN